MPKKLISFFLCIIFMSGCASTKSPAQKDTKIRTYKQDKVRVDQVVKGSLGNWENSPDVVDDPERRKTRKVYVVEFSKDADPLPEDAFDVEEIQREPLSSYSNDDTMEDAFEESTSKTIVATRPQPTTRQQPKFNFPNFDEDDDARDMIESTATTPTTQATSFVDYKVKKDDTLQKISKKYYNSYSKWTKIYEANKKIIKDPNFIKPGITIKIPME